MNDAQLVLLGAGISLVTTIIVTLLTAYLTYRIKRKERADEMNQRSYYLHGRMLQLEAQWETGDKRDADKYPKRLTEEFDTLKGSEKDDPRAQHFYIGYMESALEEKERMTAQYLTLDEQRQKLEIGYQKLLEQYESLVKQENPDTQKPKA